MARVCKDRIRCGRWAWPIFLRFVAVAIVLFAGSACGKKGAPRAPELAMPQVIDGLEAEAGDNGVVLTWERPTRYVDGRRLRDLDGFVIFRKELLPTCPGCPAPYREQATVPVDDRERFIQKRKFSVVDRRLTPGATYFYRVVSRLVDGSLSRPSNEVKVVWRP